jgi:pSer/pThr/pTyr-binding forkhead associated (FHA) protein
VPLSNSGPVVVGKAPTPPPVPALPSVAAEAEDRTFIVPEALLLSEADNGQAVNFRLTALTYIGRSEDNQLRLLDPGVSRRHVLVMATPGGYTIRDLGSQNGTYVNGTRVDESPLTDGDRITIGEINLVFRGAPAAVSA